MFVLVGVVLLCIAATVLALRVLAPGEESLILEPTVAPEEPARPKPTSATGQVALEPSTPPALAAPTHAPQPGRASAAPTSTPATVSTNTKTSPADTITQHYALITARDYSAGYGLMSSRLQRLNTPADYASWFTNKVSLQPLSIDIVSQSDDEAVVRSTVESTDRVNGTETKTLVREEFVLSREGGVWRIDQVTRI